MRCLLLFVFLFMFLGVVFGADPAAPGDMVRVGERNVRVQCAGTGDRTVLLVSGIPRFSFHFSLVQSEAAKFARVCAYDKGGEAWTDPLPSLTAEDMLRELDAVVQRVGGDKPVILAGHSFGGILVRAYYRMRPEQVRGLVLIDTPHPDMIRMPVNGQSKKMYDLTEADMQAAAEFGRKRNIQTPHPTKIDPPFDRLPANLHESHMWAMKKSAEASRGIDPLTILKVQSEFARRIRDQRFEVPTIVITRAKSADETDPWVGSQQTLANAAADGKLVRAVGSGHDIELEQPELIIEAVRELLAPAKAAKTAN
ncbi:MAG TPA: alpha/beta hydrolase [Bryobacteraceae bacterium]|nr:alpha/beta hydrolase [Bryobacteraceae bacterium]